MCVPKFDGKKSAYSMWMARFEAFAVLEDFSEAIQKTAESDLPAKASDAIQSGDDGKEARAAKKRNQRAFYYLTMAFQTEGLISKIHAAKTQEYPEGLAWMVIAALEKEYRPNDLLSRVDLRADMNKVRLRVNDEPTKLKEQICWLQNHYNHGTTAIAEEADMVALVLEKAPDKYAILLKNVQLQEAEAGRDLTVTKLIDAMNNMWRIQGGLTKKDNSDGDEVALGTVFRGSCNNCGEKGHKANTCLKSRNGGGNNHNNNRSGSGIGSGNSNGRGKRFNGNCHKCGKGGHRQDDCWLLEKNASKRPANWKAPSNNNSGGGSESNAGAVRGIEMMLASVDMDLVKDVISDPSTLGGHISMY